MTDQTVAMFTPSVIDVAEFARLGTTLSGDISVRDLPRLQDLVVMGDERLQYELRGEVNPRREAQIACIIHGLVSLECQRCLGTFDHCIDTASTLVFVSDESKLPPVEEEDESMDYVVAEAPMEVRALIEDEIILALPVAPRHAAGECKESPLSKESKESKSTDDKPSPFAALARLKRKR